MHPCLLLAWLAPRLVVAPKPRDIRGAGEAAPRAFDHYRHVHVPKTAGTVFRADAARILPRNATLHTAEKCYCTKYKLRNDAPTILFVRIPEAAGVVEAATGTRVLCPKDVLPATRAALATTAAGRRLVAALDAGALPQPKPGLLPRRADGVSPVPCSFH